MKLSSVSYCASLVASLKPKSSIHNELAQGLDKSSIMSDYSHCCSPGLLCSHEMGSLKHLILTVGCGLYGCQIGRSASHAKKLHTTEKQSKVCPCSPFSVFLYLTIAQSQNYYAWTGLKKQNTVLKLKKFTCAGVHHVRLRQMISLKSGWDRTDDPQTDCSVFFFFYVHNCVLVIWKSKERQGWMESKTKKTD